MQAQDNVLFSGKIQEYEAAFELVDTEKKGEMPSCCRVGLQAMQVYSYGIQAPVRANKEYPINHLESILLCPAGSVTASQLAQLFTNLGNPLPYDRLSAIMQEYDVSKSGQVLISWAPNKLHKETVQ